MYGALSVERNPTCCSVYRAICCAYSLMLKAVVDWQAVLDNCVLFPAFISLLYYLCFMMHQCRYVGFFQKNMFEIINML